MNFRNRTKFAVYGLCLPFVFFISNVSCQEQSCKEASTPLELSECLGKQYHEQDSILNATYKIVMSKISTVYKKKPKEALAIKNSLKRMQKQWIVSRDQHCQFVCQIATVESPTTGNQLHQSTFTDISCKSEYTKDRIRQLKEILTSLNNR